MTKTLVDDLEDLERQVRTFGHTKRADRLRSDIVVLQRMRAEAAMLAELKQRLKPRA